jgi:hypothetical protein
MKTLIESIKINTISFESGDTNVYVNAILSKEKLSYPSDLVISHTDLNVIINKLQQQNPESDISSYFDEEIMYDGSSFYRLNSAKYSTTNFQVNHFEFTQKIKQIRA